MSKMSNGKCVPDPTKWGCSCKSHVAPTGGTCVATNNCKGTSFKDQKGQTQGMGDMKGMMDMLKGLMDALKGKSGGGGSPPPPPPTGAEGQKTCTSYYQVTVPSTDPCAYYVPPTSNSLLDQNTLGGTNSASNLLLDALSGNGGTIPDLSTPANVSDQLLTSVNTDTTTQTSGTTGTNTVIGTDLGAQKVMLTSGTQGNIVVGPTGATVVASARDAEANTEVAGFYGGETFGSTQPQGIAANLCKNRPWAGSIVSFVIPPSFFDSLCAWRGYTVGVAKAAPPPAPSAQKTTAAKSTKAAPPPPPPSTPSVTPEVDIWAVPARVPLGARTSVFWNTKGVETCTVSSPDGSFNETSLSGGASTVPLSGATTFTISCLTLEGKPVTDYFVVNLTI